MSNLGKYFRLHINTERGFFGETDEEKIAEVARILGDAAMRLREGDIQNHYRILYDQYGEDVGRAAFKDTLE